MSAISSQNVRNAYKDSDKLRYIEMAKREYTIHHNDGMTLKIPQDNILDWFINTVDGRRLKLEKRAEIIHDYYADRLLTKEIFQRYLNYKLWSGGVANMLTLGLIGTNIYTRVMKNSVFMGKIGTLGSVIALQTAGRYLSNNFLEKEIERPWKIHCNRMSKGLGPTNIPSNNHLEITTSPLRFLVVPYAATDLLFGSATKTVPSNVGLKFPLLQEHYPYAPDEEDQNKLMNFKTKTYKRVDLTEPEDDGETIWIPHKEHMMYKLSGGVRAKNYYPKEFEMYKGFLMNGKQTIYKPETIHKKVAFEPRKFSEAHKDKTYEENEYSADPLSADIIPVLPLYSQQSYKDEINITGERIDLLKHHYLQRIKFKNLKKQLNEELKGSANSDEAQLKIDGFTDYLKQDDLRFLREKVQIAAPDKEKNFLDNKKTLLLFENDKQALKDYYDLVLCTRPQMIKSQKNELPYDWDFEVDLENYDPWQEYKLIYKDLFAKGRAYLIIKSIPDWKFLQVGKPESVEDESYNKLNPLRHNHRDSIFSLITQDRYFHERMTKEGRYKSRSQAIRI